MADAAVAVELVLNNLKELLDHHSHLIGDNIGQIESLQRDLRVFKAFLRDSVEKRRDDGERIKEMVQEIREVVYEVEDIIDTFVNKTMAPNNSEISSLRKFLKIPLDLHTFGKKMDLYSIDKYVNQIRKSVQQTREDIGIVKHKAEHKSQQSQVRPPRKKDVVGFEDQADDLINRLTRDSNCLEVISLVGMLGLGKTTLAWKVYQHPVIQYKFPIRIWLSISQEFSDRDIFLSILKEFTMITEDINSKADREIADLVIAYLEGETFLIIMDDVWETAHWSKLKVVLPKNNKGKVLIATRNEQVANFASRTKSIKKLRHFNDEESWKLFQLEVLGNLDCPPDLENVGRIIARNCKGLPLLVAIIGNILSAKYHGGPIIEVKKNWDEVSMGVSIYLNENDMEHRMTNLISLSYDILPYHLRSCFLYLGMFPEDYEIPSSKLIRMWIGEGFIQQSEACSLEETAKQYLEELITRNLVQSEKFKHDGKVKTCWIHGIIRDFCRTKAANENLGIEIKYVNGRFSPPIFDIDKYRCLYSHSNSLKFMSSNTSCHHTRSFVCFSKHEYLAVSSENSSKFFAAFKYLKVLDVEHCKFELIDTNIYRLVYMRYLVLSSNMSLLGSKFSQLWNIQTLIIHTTSRTLEVKADIWKMNKLRYFKTNASAILLKPSKIGQYGKELQRLGRISVESCTPELFSPASNLKRLGIRGNLNLFFYGSSFDRLGEMEDIEKLELVNDVYPYASSEKPLRGLPQHHQFPSGLKNLTLRATFLSWDAMSTLALLNKLEVLKLKENAFMGETWNWNADDGGFKCLQLLHNEDTDLMIWEASSLHYPKLRKLVLRNCEKLEAIPNCMADIPSLQMLELYSCNKSAAASAEAIKEAKLKTQPEGSAFKLSIFPPTE